MGFVILKMIRVRNTIMVGISQVFIFYFFLIPFFKSYDISPVLQGHLWWLFVLDTMLITAGGYVINDYFDQDADAINTPQKPGGLPYLKVYFLINVLGIVIATYIGIKISKPFLILIYPLAVGLLALYSSSLKKKPLVGNLIVSIFAAFVPGIIWFAESSSFSALSLKSPQTYDWMTRVLIAYITFGFLSTLSREIAKDIEDVKGDHLAGYKTLPIVAGVPKTKVLMLFNTFFLLVTFILWLDILIKYQFLVWLMVVILIAPTIYILYLMKKSSTKNDFSVISKYLKILMALGLVFFLFLSGFYNNRFF